MEDFAEHLGTILGLFHYDRKTVSVWTPPNSIDLLLTSAGILTTAVRTIQGCDGLCEVDGCVCSNLMVCGEPFREYCFLPQGHLGICKCSAVTCVRKYSM